MIHGMIFLVVSRVYQPALSAVTCSESLPCTGSKGNDAGRAEWIPFGTLLLTSEKAADFCPKVSFLSLLPRFFKNSFFTGKSSLARGEVKNDAHHSSSSILNA